MEDAEIEEGEAFCYKEATNIDPDIDLSYIVRVQLCFSVIGLKLCLLLLINQGLKTYWDCTTHFDDDDANK